MALIFFLVIALGVGAGFLWTLQEMIFKGKWSYFIFFLSAFLPFYITSLSVIFLATRSPEILGIFQILKEVVVLVAVLIFIFFQKRIFEYPFRLQSTDWMMLGFLCLGFLYLLLPLGQASFLNKALYYKSMLIPGFVYFFWAEIPGLTKSKLAGFSRSSLLWRLVLLRLIWSKIISCKPIFSSIQDMPCTTKS